ncbi:ABC-type lipopolysaccharide export system, ATPase component [Mucilaginibacter pineti]|uniref:ABC-type lipopolysaccharide export system, ATPase component n=1 Tax=Mucilaginibacter pineti TaxID=1391627 RepID=A0A1G7AH98_9SPHI|nr:ATP-binding cassette domain-containing protein [Mucilaginibacter pineti]SDE14083.1 ABC-type lipopolysaccharide export system, ATPase component [Mucilaginibacter pineti]
MTHVLRIDSVELEFDLRRILSDVFIKCTTNEIIGLLGRNGEGKTSLMNVILGNIKATNSFISFDDVKITDAFKKPHLLMYLPQFNFIPASLKLRTVFDDFGLEYAHFESKFPEFGMRFKSRVGELSGGQRRVLEIYVIAKSAALFVMMDEPFTHLNPLQIEKMKLFLQEEKINKGIIVTDHMYNHILDISDNVYILANGKTHLMQSKMDLDRLGYARIGQA